MKLNKLICELVKTNKNPNVHFANGQRVPPKDEVKYLGCHLNKHCDTQKEVKSRIARCMTTLKKIDLFWRHCDCPLKFKLLVQDAVIRSKVLYGLEPPQLTEGTLNKLDAFQLNGLRRMLKMVTTYIDRDNTNEEVYRRANAAVEEGTNTRTITKFSTSYQKQKTETDSANNEL